MNQRRIYRCTECGCTQECFGTVKACKETLRGLLWMESKKHWYCSRHRQFSAKDKAPLFIAEWERHSASALPYIPNYPFNLPDKHQLDMAFPESRVAVEINGGRFQAMGGRHMSDEDMEKINIAQIKGWKVLSFTPQKVERDPLRCIELVKLALQSEDIYPVYVEIKA